MKNYYDVENPRCSSCGRFVSSEQIIESTFIPDTPFTAEEINYYCITCVHKEAIWWDNKFDKKGKD